MSDVTYIVDAERQDKEPETIELSLKDLFWNVLSHYRSILVVMLIVGILLGGFQGIRQLRRRMNQSEMDAAEATYQEQVAAYELKKTQLQTKIDNLNREIEVQKAYGDNAVLLLTDPYNVYASVVTYYVDAGYQIVPELYYQNPNYTTAILNSYRTIVDRFDIDSVLADAENPDLTKQNPVTNNSKSMLAVTVNADNGTIALKVIGDTEEHVTRVMNALEALIAESEETIDTIIGEHDITIISEEARSTIDTDLVTLQNAYNTNLENLSKTLTDTTTEFSNLASPSRSIPTKAGIIKTTIKYGIIGLVVGLFLMLVFYALRFITRDGLVSSDDIRRRYHSQALGYLPEAGASEGKIKTGLFAKLDKGIQSRLGIQSGLSREDAGGIIAANVSLYAPEATEILLLGTADGGKIQDVKDALGANLPGVTLEAKGNMLDSAEAIRALTTKKAVVLVEETPKARHTDIRKEVAAIEASGSQLVGVVLV